MGLPKEANGFGLEPKPTQKSGAAEESDRGIVLPLRYQYSGTSVPVPEGFWREG